MLELLTDYQAWASLLTLTALEIVLGIGLPPWDWRVC
jgi:predicted tellurium resistance membrane protein TerC